MLFKDSGLLLLDKQYFGIKPARLSRLQQLKLLLKYLAYLFTYLKVELGLFGKLQSSKDLPKLFRSFKLSFTSLQLQLLNSYTHPCWLT
jgi:hypothetical protein